MRTFGGAADFFCANPSVLAMPTPAIMTDAASREAKIFFIDIPPIVD
jgi:hypothetical protein